MQIDKKKLARQEVGVDKWFNSSKHGATSDKKGCLHYFTGVGKTYTAILIMKRLFRMYERHHIIIIVPSEALQKQWEEILTSQFTKKILIQVEVFTAHWVVTNKVKIKTGTLIADELHEYLGEEFVKVIDSTYIQHDNRLGLTATYEDSKGREANIASLYPIIDEITEEEALKQGYIAPYVEFNLAVSFSPSEEEAYKRYSKVITDNLSKFGSGGLPLATLCLSGGVFEGKKWTSAQMVFGYARSKGWHDKLNLDDPREARINDVWNPHKVFGYAKNLMAAVRHRKNLVYNSKSKLNACVDILDKFHSKKAIIFSQSTAFADSLNLSLNDLKPDSSVVYHSQLETRLLPSPKTNKLIKFGKTRLKKLALDAIKSGKSKRLCTASSLDKGLDVQDLELGVTASGTANFTQYKQRGGRVKRKDIFKPFNVVLLINLYIKDTVDERWLKKRQSKSSHVIHYVNNIADISLTPKPKNKFLMKDL